MFASDQNRQPLPEQPSVSSLGTAEAGAQEIGDVQARLWRGTVEFRAFPEAARGS